MTTPPPGSREAAQDEVLQRMAEHSLAFDDKEFATRVVQLLILDKGHINAWQRTIETMLEVYRRRDALLSARGETK